MNISIIGAGYVGLSLATLLSEKHDVIALDIVEQKINKINERVSPIHDKEITRFFKTKKLNLVATLDEERAIKAADFVIIATPTDYDNKKNCFNTDSVDSSIVKVRKYNKKATIVIKSTVPVGYTKKIANELKEDNIIFSPEFLREGKALYDNLYPSRIIVGVLSEEQREKANEFAMLLKEATEAADVPVLITSTTEAEAIKLFSNTYLALRVSFFNELDTYALEKGLNPSVIIEGVGLDPRIGNYYNNPSFGYGGYCLPKDVKQLQANFEDIPQNLISATVLANKTRKKYIANKILEEIGLINKKEGNNSGVVVGIYRLINKEGSDNYRESSLIDIIKILTNNKVIVIIYEPVINNNYFMGCEVYKSIDDFKERSTKILANRFDSVLKNVEDKVFTRDNKKIV